MNSATARYQVVLEHTTPYTRVRELNHYTMEHTLSLSSSSKRFLCINKSTKY